MSAIPVLDAVKAVELIRFDAAGKALASPVVSVQRLGASLRADIRMTLPEGRLGTDEKFQELCLRLAVTGASGMTDGDGRSVAYGKQMHPTLGELASVAFFEAMQPQDKLMILRVARGDDVQAVRTEALALLDRIRAAAVPIIAAAPAQAGEAGGEPNAGKS